MESSIWAKVSNGMASSYTETEFGPLSATYLFKLSYISLHMKTIELMKIASLGGGGLFSKLLPSHWDEPEAFRVLIYCSLLAVHQDPSASPRSTASSKAIQGVWNKEWNELH